MNSNTLPKFDTIALNKAFVGVDRVLNSFENRFASQLATNYPPHNIIKLDDNHYVIEMAVAGFAKSDISVEIVQDQLTIKCATNVTENDVQYIYRGLSTRDFIRHFRLAEHLVVTSASIDNGILTISLELVVPEEMKPRMIEIQG